MEKKCSISVNIDIAEILTQRTCANIIIEFIKFLSYQKLQIPYQYEVLNYLVAKKRDKDKSTQNLDENWQSQKYFHTTSTAITNFDSIFKNILLEMEGESPPEELAVVLGASPVCPKEVFRITLPSTLHKHFHNNHMLNSPKLVLKVLRKISFCEELNKAIFNPLTPTNTFIFFKRTLKDTGANSSKMFSDFFLPRDNLRIPPKVPQFIINLNYQPDLSSNCCSEMKIFDQFSVKTIENIQNLFIHDTPEIQNLEDGCSSSSDVSKCIIGESLHDQIWFQANVPLKGFKDCIVQGKSISNTWIAS